MNKVFIAFPLSALLLVGVGCGSSKPLPTTQPPQSESQTVSEKPPTIPEPNPIKSKYPATVVTNDTGSDLSDPRVYAQDDTVIRARPENEVCDTKNAICVPSRFVYASVGKGLELTGTGIAFEQTFQWRVMRQGEKVASGVITTQAPEIGIPGDFSLSIKEEYLAKGKVELEFYESSAKDGSEIHLVRIPLRP